MIFRRLLFALGVGALVLGLRVIAADDPRAAAADARVSSGESRATGNDSLARFDRVVVEPAKTSIYVGSVTMTFSPGTRKGGVYAADYSAKVFPYFFMSEQGHLTLDAPDELLRRLARGEPVDFSGRGMSSSGDARRFEGHATPIDATSGKLKVHAFVSKRIDLIFNMTYRFAPATP